MFDWLRSLYQKLTKPIEPGLVRIVKRKLSPPAPSPEEFVSPLKTEVTELLAIKPDIGYNEHCASCRGHLNIDGKLQTAVDTKDDPQPWLKEVHEAIIENTDEQRRTQAKLDEEGQLYTPSKRWLIAISATSGATLGGLIAKVAWDVYVRDFILTQLLPWLVTLLTL